MSVSNQQLQEMFRNIPDPHLRSQLSDIVNGRVVKNVYCTSKKCKGRLIGQILDTGKVNAVADNGKTYLRASRHRLDGFMGFECWCGNDSRLAKQEKGHIGAFAPDKTALQKVWENLNFKPSDYPVVNGEQNIDGFILKEMV